VLIDLHCHTLPLSTCSALHADELVRAARERGLDGICLTEHDRAWPVDEREALRQRTGFPVFSAVELSTDMGHILAFGLDDPGSFSAVASEVYRAAAACGGVLFLAHPARDGLLKVTRETVEYFASVEAINGSDSRLQNLASSGLAHGFRLPGIGGSDAHTAAEVGRAATRFTGRIETQRDLLEALRAGEYGAVALE
jgi:predicted metal-dependent phosphoesterase TrpH